MMKKYYRLVDNSFYEEGDPIEGSVCYQTKAFSTKNSYPGSYYFPSIESHFFLKEESVEEITKEEYMKEIWKTVDNN